MVVKYWYRVERKGVGTKGPFQCDKDEIKQIIKHWHSRFLWLKVELPSKETWIYGKYLGGWKKIRN